MCSEWRNIKECDKYPPECNKYPPPESKLSCTSETRPPRTGEELSMAPSSALSCSGPTALRSPGCWTEQGINSSRLQPCGKDYSRLQITAATKVFLLVISERFPAVEAGNVSAPTRFVLAFFSH